LIPYRAMLDVPMELVSYLENLIATRRSELRSPWRKLTSYDQAVLTLVGLRDGDTFAQLAAHFGVGLATAWRYVDESMTVLTAQAPTLAETLREVATTGWPHGILDGALIPTDRCATPPAGYRGDNADPYYSGKHRKPGVNLQAITGPRGQLAFLGATRCGSTHDLTAARAEDLIDVVTHAGLEVLADAGYVGAGGTVRTPIKKPKGRELKAHDRYANALNARLRAPGERGFAVLKGWKILTKVRISPNRITALVKSIFTLIRKQASLPRA
jgi:hypothetical protein